MGNSAIELSNDRKVCGLLFVLVSMVNFLLRRKGFPVDCVLDHPPITAIPISSPGEIYLQHIIFIPVINVPINCLVL
jgi:hypothetical protein